MFGRVLETFVVYTRIVLLMPFFLPVGVARGEEKGAYAVVERVLEASTRGHFEWLREAVLEEIGVGFGTIGPLSRDQQGGGGL